MFFGMIFSIRVDIHQHIGIKCQITFFNYHSNPYRIINQIIPYQHCILIHVNMGKRVLLPRFTELSIITSVDYYIVFT